MVVYSQGAKRAKPETSGIETGAKCATTYSVNNPQFMLPLTADERAQPECERVCFFQNILFSSQHNQIHLLY